MSRKTTMLGNILHAKAGIKNQTKSLYYYNGFSNNGKRNQLALGNKAGFSMKQ